MSKKDDSPAISLFSFQDIITSITGIMFLVVLLLILLIFQSKPGDPKETSEQVSSELENDVHQLEQELAELRKKDQLLKEQLEEYRKMPAEKIEQKQWELRAKEKKLRQQNQELKEKERQEKMVESELTVRNETQKKQKEKLTEEIKKVQTEITESEKVLEQTKQQLETANQTIKFSVEQASDKNALLVEFKKNGFRVLDMATQTTYDLRENGASLQRQIQILKTWLNQRDRHSETISVILGPADLQYWQTISEELAKLRFIHGLELYPDNDTSIFPKGKK